MKVRSGSRTEEVIQLHDEMARLVREHIWPYWDNSGEKKQALLTAIDQYDDQLIAEQMEEEADILRVEKLYYALLQDKDTGTDIGRRLWFKLAGLGNESINKLLPGEIKSYIQYYDVETQYELNCRIAEIESEGASFQPISGILGEGKKAGGKLEGVRTGSWMPWLVSSMPAGRSTRRKH